MRNNFTPGECALCTTKEEYEALKAVMLADGFPVFSDHRGYRGSCFYGISDERLGFSYVVIGSGKLSGVYREIPLSEALFRGAPDFATLLVTVNNRYYWLDDNQCDVSVKIVRVGSDGHILDSGSVHWWHEAKVIAKRDPQKSQVEILAETVKEWPDNLGKAGLLVQSNPEFDIVTVWRGNQWHTESINGVTKEQWLDAVTLSEQDMVKLAGRDMQAQLESDMKDSWYRLLSFSGVAEDIIKKGWVKK